MLKSKIIRNSKKHIILVTKSTLLFLLRIKILFLNAKITEKGQISTSFERRIV